MTKKSVLFVASEGLPFIKTGVADWLMLLALYQKNW